MCGGELTYVWQYCALSFTVVAHNPSNKTMQVSLPSCPTRLQCPSDSAAGWLAGRRSCCLGEDQCPVGLLKQSVSGVLCRKLHSLHPQLFSAAHLAGTAPCAAGFDVQAHYVVCMAPPVDVAGLACAWHVLLYPLRRMLAFSPHPPPLVDDGCVSALACMAVLPLLPSQQAAHNGGGKLSVVCGMHPHDPARGCCVCLAVCLFVRCRFFQAAAVSIQASS